ERQAGNRHRRTDDSRRRVAARLRGREGLRRGRHLVGAEAGRPQSAAIAAVYLKSLRMTCPPFITNFTFDISVMSARGSPATATRSPNLPFSTLPTSPVQPMRSAAIEVDARSACTGVIPHFTRYAN